MSSSSFNIHKDLLIDHGSLKVIEKVGEGTYGEVWKGKWGGVTVAIKKLHIYLATPEAVKILEKEINTAARLRHPHVVQMYGVCVKSETEIWLVMEFADGGSLFSKLADKQTEISWETRMQWVNSAALAVAFLHERKLLHRDIKSPNFVLVEGRLKITDFGMSETSVNSLASLSSLNIKREGGGSIRWMAPETTAEIPEFSEKSDIFGLGMVFWEITSREIPFSHVIQEVQVIYLIKHEKVRPKIPSDCPRELADVIIRCWQPLASDRPSAYEILNLLESPSVSLPPFPSPSSTSPSSTSPSSTPPSSTSPSSTSRSPSSASPSSASPSSSSPPSSSSSSSSPSSFQLRLSPLQTVSDATQSPSPPKSPAKKFFEVNYRDLLLVVPPEHIRILKDPPQIPQQLSLAFSPPPKVEIFSLFPPPSTFDTQHMLVSERYDFRLFSRVAEYFYRFYVPQNAQTAVKLEKVEVIFNSALEEQFRNTNEMFELKFRGHEEFESTEKSKMEQKYLSNLLASKNLVANCNSNPISAWHGANKNNLDSICWFGLLNLSTNDAGYYGKGIYLTQEPNYGEYYAEEMREKKEGNFSLLLCWALIGKPRAITKVQLGSSPQGCTSHYVLVKKKQAKRSFCETESDFEMVEGVSTFFPIEENEEAQGDEIVVFDSSQVLPRFIVHYSVHTPVAPPPSPPPLSQRKSKEKGFFSSVFPSLPSLASPPSPKMHFKNKYKTNEEKKKPIASTKFLETYKLPPGKNLYKWIAMHLIEQYNYMITSYGIVSHLCETCTQMTAGPNVTYFWMDGKNQISLSAEQFIVKVKNWIKEQLDDEKIFPPLAAGFLFFILFYYFYFYLYFFI